VLLRHVSALKAPFSGITTDTIPQQVQQIVYQMQNFGSQNITVSKVRIIIKMQKTQNYKILIND
jgi:hypothetical protein